MESSKKLKKSSELLNWKNSLFYLLQKPEENHNTISTLNSDQKKPLKIQSLKNIQQKQKNPKTQK